MASVKLEIKGMHCAGCAGRAERALASVEGVRAASVNYATSLGYVDAGDEVDLAALEVASTGAGYPARMLASGETTATPAARARAEAQHAARAALIAAVLTLPVFLTEMGGHLFPAFHTWLYELFGQAQVWRLQFVLTTLVLIWPGRAFFGIGVPALLRGAPEMNSLVALGAFAAWAYSTVVLVAPGLLPDAARVVYFEAAAVIVTLILLGRFLEARAKGRAGAAIEALIGLQPHSARVERKGEIAEIALEMIVPGDILHLRPGDRIAVDGEVLTGQSHVDEAMLTGEAAPVAKAPGDRLVGGTINGQGALTYRATSVGEDTVLARIIAMVEEAQGGKLPVQALADRVVRVFVPVVLAVALATLVVWLLFGPGVSFALVAAVSVLIIACPCAMGLATPTSIMVGTGRAAELGVFFRKGAALQHLSQVRLVAFDKTGTLTKGALSVTEIALAPGRARDATLAILAAVEAQSEHPTARAIEAAAEGLDLPEASDVRAIPGQGVVGRVDGQSVLIGTARLMGENGVDLPNAARGQVHAAMDGAWVASLTIADQVKPTSRDVIAALHDQGYRTAMISGDARATADQIARELGIDHVVAEVLPDGKTAALRDLRATHGPVAFVGDGINDAPALAEADTGIAVGTGTDVSIEAADVVLLSGDLTGVVTALRMARRTMRNIRQNLFWAFAYNVALIPVAAGVLYPLTGLMLSPMLAAGAMALSSVFVVSNALRLRFVKA